MDKLDGGKASYVIISIDLNDLKYINDTYGHAEGDRLIATFGEILKKPFRSTDLVARMGGDEFIVVMQGATIEVAIKKVAWVISLLDEQNKRDTISYKFAYGIASSDEFSNKTARDIYMVADQRMYDLKADMHKSTDYSKYVDLNKDIIEEERRELAKYRLREKAVNDLKQRNYSDKEIQEFVDGIFDEEKDKEGVEERRRMSKEAVEFLNKKLIELENKAGEKSDDAGGSLGENPDEGDKDK